MLPLYAAAPVCCYHYATAAASTTALINGSIKVGVVKRWTDGWWDGCAAAGRLVRALCAVCVECTRIN